MLLWRPPARRELFPQSPGGPDELPKECCLRLSLCCGQEGCRKRLTPPSVRFLGPKVYLLPVIFLAAAMRQGPSPRSMRELSTLFGADRRTIARWQVFWQEHFPQTRFWKVERARLPHPNEATLLPRGLVVAFFTSPNPRDDWERLLRFLAPITIAEDLCLRFPDDFDLPAEDALRAFWRREVVWS